MEDQINILIENIEKQKGTLSSYEYFILHAKIIELQQKEDELGLLAKLEKSLDIIKEYHLR